MTEAQEWRATADAMGVTMLDLCVLVRALRSCQGYTPEGAIGWIRAQPVQAREMIEEAKQPAMDGI